MSKSLDNYIGLNDSPFDKLEKSMKVPDEVLKQYFELATDLSTEEIESIMSGDIREAHFRFGEELIKMYDDINEFESIKKRYLEIAAGGIPKNISEMKLSEDKINICELLVKIGFANSKGEAKRMILGNGIKINSELKNDISEEINIISGEIIIQFGKNKFMKIV